jgi:oxygen-independent coproporphyrinogen-3 oxidase
MLNNPAPNLPLPQHPAGAQPPLRYQPLPAPGQPTQLPALYVHVPFCTVKCHYCDFFSVAGHLDQAEAYLDALEKEAQLVLLKYGPQQPHTIFIGGGTPTLLPPGQLARLLGIIAQLAGTRQLREYTVESNPNTFDRARADVLAQAGVTRVSFGAQSFNPDELHSLQRDHDPASLAPAIAALRAAGIKHYNIDLIFGISGQTLASWDYSLTRALELQPEHLSCYSLMYEPNTALTARLHSGQVQTCDEDLEADLLQHARQKLISAGLHAYEISNYARPGFECQHNLAYWRGADYLALGPAAAGHWSGHRWKNVPSLNRYIAALTDPQPVLPIAELEHLTPAQRAGELVMLMLRLRSGLDLAWVRQRLGLDLRADLIPASQRYVAEGLLTWTGDILQLTESAILISDTILSDLVTAVEAGVEARS